MSELERILRDERGSLQEELEKVRALITESEQRLTRIIERLRHVDGLLGGTPHPTSSDVRTATTLESPTPPSRRESIADLAAQVLHEHRGKPMYYKDLAKEVERLGGQISGSTPGATLVARLVLDDRFVRPTSKGFYGLRADFPTARNVGARRRSARRRA